MDGNIAAYESYYREEEPKLEDMLTNYGPFDGPEVRKRIKTVNGTWGFKVPGGKGVGDVGAVWYFLYENKMMFYCEDYRPEMFHESEDYEAEQEHVLAQLPECYELVDLPEVLDLKIMGQEPQYNVRHGL